MIIILDQPLKIITLYIFFQRYVFSSVGKDIVNQGFSPEVPVWNKKCDEYLVL